MQLPTTPTWWRIDSDHFQYGGILRKVERDELGKEVGADEEEVFKEKRHVARGFSHHFYSLIEILPLTPNREASLLGDGE